MHAENSRLIRKVFGDKAGIGRFPWVNQLILVYCGVIIVCFALFLIAPFVAFISQTPLNHIQAYLGLLGAGLLGLDLFTNRGLWHGKYVALLYGLCILAAVASLRTISYGLKDNLFLLCWTGIQFAMFYTLPNRISRESMKKFAAITFGVLAVIWLVAVCYSLSQYVRQIGYWFVVDPTADDSSAARQGFLEHRLFGIFNPLNHSVFVSVMLVLASIYYLIRAKHLWQRVLLVLGDLAFTSHIILSGSRSAQVALLACTVCLSLFAARNLVKSTGIRRFVLLVTAPVVGVALAVGCFTVMKQGLAQTPQLWQAHQLANGNIIELDSEDGTIEILDQNGELVQNPEAAETILNRTGLEEDVSNDRFKIWKDYIGQYRQIGLLGLSPGNYMSYIAKNAPDLYIVKYVQEKFPEKFAGGLIYHVHNGYLMTFVSTGLLGTLLMAAFILLSVQRSIVYLVRNPKISWEYLCVFLLVLAGALAALFDKGVFFMNNAHTFIFWLALGLINAAPDKEKEYVD